MAVTVTATPVDDASGWAAENTPPAKHAGWNNPAGDRDWVPDVSYYRRYLLKCEGPEVGSVVNWEVYDTTTIPFVADVAAYVPTPGAEPRFVNDEKTKKVWAWAVDKYVNTNSNWISLLRANGPRALVELPAYLKWAEGVDAEQTVTFTVRAFLPGSFGKMSGEATVTVNNPDIDKL